MPERTTGGPRKRPRQKRARVTVESIVAATERVVAQEGVEGATTNRIAEVAGVSIGSLYQYFPNKQALIGIVRERESRNFKTDIEPEVAALARLPLRQAVRGIVDLLIARHRDRLDVHNALAVGDDGLVDELEERWLPVVVNYLAERREEIRPANLELAGRIALEVIEAQTHGVALRCPERLDDPEYACELTELLVRYLGK